MKFPLKLTQTSTSLAILILLATASIFANSQSNTQPLATLNITAQTNQQKYYLREPVAITGTLTDGGQPATNALIAMEIRDPRGDPFAYRTIAIGNPQWLWPVNITNVYIRDQNNIPITTAKINTIIKLSITVKSNLLNDITAVIAYTLYDNTLIPIRSSQWQLTITAQQTQTVTGQVYIPEWATPGKAIISANVFNKFPKDGGIPLIPEKITYIYITRNEQQPEPYTPYAPKSYETQPGQYQINVRMSPDRYAQLGTYNVYVRGMVSQMSITGTSTSFTMEDDPSPPQAAFTYYPPKLYANMTATFDASSSSAEGYNDTIIRYEWYINDPNNPEHIIREGNYTNPPSPLVQHNFRYGGTYTVSLNVTDNEGLWSYTIKPVTVYPEYGPTANFTWTPYRQVVNRTVTFNASGSQPGWSAQIGDFSPIVLYAWNFSDGTGKINTTNPIITHNYTQPGNYTVFLTVTDSVGRTNTISAQIEILNVTSNIYDVNGDGKVGVDDIVMVAMHFGTRVGDPNWDPRCDVTGDGKVGVDDIVLVAKHFGEKSY